MQEEQGEKGRKEGTWEVDEGEIESRPKGAWGEPCASGRFPQQHLLWEPERRAAPRRANRNPPGPKLEMPYQGGIVSEGPLCPVVQMGAREGDELLLASRGLDVRAAVSETWAAKSRRAKVIRNTGSMRLECRCRLLGRTIIERDRWRSGARSSMMPRDTSARISLTGWRWLQAAEETGQAAGV